LLHNQQKAKIVANCDHSQGYKQHISPNKHNKIMQALQIQSFPDDLYHALCSRAALAHRSLSQQTVIELRRSQASSNTEQPISPRQQTLNAIRNQYLAPLSKHSLENSSEQITQWIRESRDRSDH
jgi:plasmid stability protein